MLGSVQETIRNSQVNQAWSELINPHKLNINSFERTASLLGGVLLLVYGLRRLSFVSLGAILGAGYMFYRGLTGYCSLYEALGINTTRSKRLQFDKLSQEYPNNTTDDMIDETVWQTFPASDPPASW